MMQPWQRECSSQMSQDYYKLLGVDRVASQETIKAAFRKVIRQNHPDLFKSYKDKADATVRTRQYIEAYKVLTDAEARIQYDQEIGSSVPSKKSEPPTPPNPDMQSRPFYKSPVKSPLLDDEADFSRIGFVISSLRNTYYFLFSAAMLFVGVYFGISWLVDLPSSTRFWWAPLLWLLFGLPTFPLGADVYHRIRFIREVFAAREDIRDIRWQIREDLMSLPAPG